MKMVRDLTFESVCKSVTDEYPDIGEDINTLSDIALILSVAAAAGPITMVTVAGTTPPSPALIALTAVGTLANLFTVKDKISQTVERIMNRLMSRKDDDPLHWMSRMERAYYLICYTAFFEALSCEKGLLYCLRE